MRHPRRRTHSATRSLFTSGAVALMLISGAGSALAQPVTTPLPTPSAAPDAATVERAPAPAELCVSTPTTSPSATTSPAPTTDDAAPAACDAVDAAPTVSTVAPSPPTSAPTTTPPAAAPATTTSATPSGEKIPYTGLPTENPNSTIIPGQMRSDREEWPEPFTKEDADRAEVREFELQQRQSAARGPAPGPDCQQYWPSDKWVCGAIRDKYNSLGAQFSFLLWPTSDELVNPDGFGRRQTFQNGPIYWSAASGAHPVANHFFAAWQRNGWEAGPLKYPTTDEIVNADGLGRRQEFQGGTVYWKLNEAYFVGGAIRDRWAALGSEAQSGILGYPTSDETLLPDGQGRMNRFESGVIYWHPNFGAHEVGGLTLALWAISGYEAGQYGYPTTAQYLNPAGDLVQGFSNGEINLTQLMRNAGNIAIAGKQVNNILAESLRQYAERNGFDLDEVLGEGSGTARRASNDGGVSVPAGYVYDTSLGSLNDYCTNSPDQFPSPGDNADFSGACARHDMCYEANDGNDDAMAQCNTELRENLLTVCRNVYTGTFDPRRSACTTTAREYFEAVALAHPGQYF
ncbi:hypothetical protein CH275_09795 [Rhodococcus sp. 06-235-1A]|nr:hypothetical protein CH275_09795 [Rhodococcus sp. 06-235-1A]